MGNLLRKIFIKDYQNVGEPKVRGAHGRLAAWFGAISNIFLFAIKIVAGIITSSISIITDAINNLSDMANCVITLVGFKLSQKPADKEHPFGHGKIEYIAGLLVSAVIVALSIILGYNSLMEIIGFFKGEATGEEQNIVFKIITLSILGLAIIIKLIQGFVYRNYSKLIDSVTLKANSVDSFTDCISTAAVLVSYILTICFGWYFLDGFIGIVVAIFLLINGIKMIKETSDPLIGQSIDKEYVGKIIEKIMTYDGVLGTHDLMCHMYGHDKAFISVHVEVSASRDILESHDLIDTIEMDIKKNFHVDIVIHMDPVNDKDPVTNEYREKVSNIVSDIDENLSIHDFRIVSGPTHTNLLFDVVVPFSFKLSDVEILKIIREKVNEGSDVKFYVVANVDRPFVN